MFLKKHIAIFLNSILQLKKRKHDYQFSYNRRRQVQINKKIKERSFKVTHSLDYSINNTNITPIKKNTHMKTELVLNIPKVVFTFHNSYIKER